jgi:hypothetical protein
MTIYILPTFAQTSPRWTVRVDLSGTRYTLYLSWNEQMQSWFLSLLHADGTPIIAGIRLVPNTQLLDCYRTVIPTLPSGSLIVMDAEQRPDNDDLNRTNLGTRYQLCYVEASF